MTGYDVPPADEVTAGFWAATRQRRLMLQRCRSCRGWQHYPRAVCIACGCLDLDFTDVAGTGAIDSFTVVHRAPDPGVEVPYVVARVRLAEGPLLLANIVDSSPDRVRCDQPVRLGWRPLPDGRQLPVFTIEGP